MLFNEIIDRDLPYFMFQSFQESCYHVLTDHENSKLKVFVFHRCEMLQAINQIIFYIFCKNSI